MTLDELMKLLVETEDSMARMELVEQNKEVWQNPQSAQQGENWEEKYNILKQKYIDTFFNPETIDNSIKEEVQQTEDNSETISIDELLEGGK